jgi:hypothetical protein
MTSAIKVKVRFNASKESIEKFGEGKYLVYLPYPEDDDSANILTALISRSLGVVPKRIEFAGVDAQKNWVFELI